MGIGRPGGPTNTDRGQSKQVEFPALWSIVVLAVLLGGCAPLTYAPNSHPAPLFRGPGEFQAWARVANSQFVIGDRLRLVGLDREAQVAFSPVNHLSVFAGAAAGYLTGERRHTFGEFGLGTYFSVGRSYTSELFVGYGQGHARASGHIIPFKGGEYGLRTDYRRVFVQMGIGAEVDSATVGGVLIKVSRTQMYNVVNDGRDAVGHQGLYVEPACFVRQRVGPFSIEGQVGLNVPMKHHAGEELH